MKRFAQIVNGKVHYIFEAEKMPEVSNDVFILDITKNKEVTIGWGYDIYNKKFKSIEVKEESIEKEIDPQQKLLAQMRLEMINLLSELEVI